MLVIILVTLGVLALLFGINYLFPIIQVVGESMYPTYLDGEILVGTRLYRKSKLKKGDVIVYYSPTEEKKAVIKRIDSVSVGISRNELDFYCLGDNADRSYDSRDYGYISSKRIVCKIIDQRRRQF